MHYKFQVITIYFSLLYHPPHALSLLYLIILMMRPQFPNMERLLCHWICLDVCAEVVCLTGYVPLKWETLFFLLELRVYIPLDP